MFDDRRAKHTENVKTRTRVILIDRGKTRKAWLTETGEIVFAK